MNPVSQAEIIVLALAVLSLAIGFFLHVWNDR